MHGGKYYLYAMFRHTGKGRTFKHNLRVAALLSFIAGLVNITGVLSVNVLTTNVTGHFAFFSEELFLKQYWQAAVFLIYIFSFLAGAYLSTFITEFFLRRGRSQSHRISIFIEAVILLVVGLTGRYLLARGWNGHFIAAVLLLAMGMQNSLVTIISDRVVRTTHLTGLFTDLGIELSQLHFYREREQQIKLKRSIRLRLVIILFFFSGCVIGGFLFMHLNWATLVIASGLLIVALVYDTLLLNYYRLLRKTRRRS